MCFKKPPKAEDSQNENAHYQRAHAKNIKMAVFSKAAGVVNISPSFIAWKIKHIFIPGTSEGFSGARNQAILTLSDINRARKLPKYDWPEK